MQANSNFHTVTRGSVFDLKMGTKSFMEYRKRWNEYPANFIVGEFPLHLDIESTSFCNLRCPFCASTSNGWGPQSKGFMEFSMFKRIIDEGVEHGLCSIKLSLRGEPLLHKGLVEEIKYAKDKGILDVYFNTNAVLLNEGMAEQLIKAGLDRISVSFEGTEKETYESYRVGACYEDVVANVISLRKIRDKMKSSIPQIRVQTVLLPKLKDSFKEYVKFWQSIADEVSYLDARDETQVDYHCQQKKGHVELPGNWACPFLWQRMMILWDGTVLPCFMHGIKDFKEMPLGNVKNDRLFDMWHSDKFTRCRDFHKSGRAHELEACRACSYRTMELGKLKDKHKKM